MKSVVPVAVALAIVALATYWQGYYSERWGRIRTDRLVEFTQRLSDVPMVIGDWEGTDQEVDEEQFAASHCDGQVSRSYKNRRNGDEVSVYLVSGIGRHVTIHTPDWCYRGAGYDMDEDPIPYEIPVDGLKTNPELRTTTFTKHEVTGATDRLRIFWSFTDDGVWRGPASPKPEYGTRDALYKVYFITQASVRHESPEDSPTLQFAQEFFPAVNKALFSTPAQDQETLASAKTQGN